MPEQTSMHCARCKVGWVVAIRFDQWTSFLEHNPGAICWSCGERGAFGSVFQHCRRGE